MGSGELEDILPESISSHYEEFFNHLLITQDLKDGSWKSDLLYSSLALRAIKDEGVDYRANKGIEWIEKNLETQLNDLEDGNIQRNLERSFRSVSEAILTLEYYGKNLSDYNRFIDIVKDYSKDKGLFDDLETTSLALRAISELNPEEEFIEDSISNFIRYKIHNSKCGVVSLSHILLLPQLNDSLENDLVEILEGKFDKSDLKNLKSLSLLLVVSDKLKHVDKDSIILKLHEELLSKYDRDFKINSRLTKALWQSALMRSQDYSPEQITELMNSQGEEADWANYLSDLNNENSGFMIELEIGEEDLNSISESTISIIDISYLIFALKDSNLFHTKEVAKENFDRLKELDNREKQIECLNNPLLVEKKSMIGLATLSAFLVITIFPLNFLPLVPKISDFIFYELLLLRNTWWSTMLATAFLAYIGYWTQTGRIKTFGSYISRKIREVISKVDEDLDYSLEEPR